MIEKKKYIFFALIILVLICFSGCETVGDIQPLKESVWELSANYPEIGAVIKGTKTYQELSPEAQQVYIREKAKIDLAKMVMKDPRFSPEQIKEILSQSSVSDMKKSYEESLNLAVSTKMIFEAEVIPALQVPEKVAVVYVFLQKSATLEDGSSELLGRISRDDFINKFREYIKIAKSKEMKLVITASTADEKQWLQSQIKYKGKFLMPTTYRDPSQSKINVGAEVPLE